MLLVRLISGNDNERQNIMKQNIMYLGEIAAKKLRWINLSLRFQRTQILNDTLVFGENFCQ